MAHLLRRAAFGARPDEINEYLKQGFEATVEQLVNYENTPEDSRLSDVPADTAGAPYELRYQVTRYTPPGSTTPQDIPNALTMDRLAGWWLDRMVKTRRPLQEKLVIFWHDHFSTSFSKINNSKWLYWQNKLCREQASGDFRALLKGINRDPAMIEWLDSHLNRLGSPNENYARELMELFALGFENYQQGAYTEADVQQAARAFTGWSLKYTVEQRNGNGFNGNTLTPGELIDLPPDVNDNSAAARRHDYGNKTVFGVSRDFNGDAIVDLILDHEPQRTFAARFLGQKLWEYFAYEAPEPQVVEHLALVAKRANFNVKAILRDMFLNVKEFYSDRALHRQIKQPVHFAVSALRLLQATVETGNRPGQSGTLNNNLRTMGQWLFWPPDVSGWTGGADWVSTSQYFARANQASYANPEQPAGDLPRLLGATVAPALKAFYDDLVAHGMEQRALILLWSEFGRRVAQNNNGTDHGTANNVLALGGRVKGGVYGQDPNLTDLDRGNLKFKIDFRAVYQTIIESWLGNSSAEAQQVLNGSFGNLGFIA
jgi:uncharacterized protein (DUF1800 family)